MLEWKEWEHELNDQVVLNDNATIDSLRNCGLLKFFMCLGLRVQPLLLQRMVAMRDSDSQHFVVGDQVLEMDIDDIYFLTRLCHRGELVLFGGQGGSGELVDSYVNDLCMPGTSKQAGKLPFQHVSNVALQNIIFKVTQLVGSTSTQLASKSQVVMMFENHGWVGFQLVHKFVGKPQRPIDALSARSAKTVLVWIDLGILIFLEGPIHASVGLHPIIHY